VTDWGDEIPEETNPFDQISDEWLQGVEAEIREETHRRERIRTGEALANLIYALLGRPDPNRRDESKRAEDKPE
jgi:hypothetical protein